MDRIRILAVTIVVAARYGPFLLPNRYASFHSASESIIYMRYKKMENYHYTKRLPISLK